MLGSIISTYKIIDRSEVWTSKIINLHILIQCILHVFYLMKKCHTVPLSRVGKKFSKRKILHETMHASGQEKKTDRQNAREKNRRDMPCVNSGEKETQTRAWKAGGTFVEFPPIVGRFSVGLKPTKTFGNHCC